MNWLKQFAAAVVLCGAANVPAQVATTLAGEEIAHLFEQLEESGCEFYRNGAWHDSAKASAHLREKYEYLLAKKQISTAEDFIERAATKSSLSGRPYGVRCAGQPRMDSATWFRAALSRWRAAPR